MRPSETYSEALVRLAERVDAFLAARLGEDGPAPRLVAAMRHAVLGGGKRLRPFLLAECAALFGSPLQAALPAAAALELVHAYSLVHDDLPAMDDDDLRRGRPTVHVAFDEATAILAGDALLTLAFEIMAEPATHPDAALRSWLVNGLARAAGTAGMAAGQALDLAYEHEAADAVAIRRMEALKTGALFRFACVAGARIAGAGESDLVRVTRFAEAFGEAFQITDDLLDEEASEAEAGKRTGKDAARGKQTLVRLMGPEAARARAAELVGEAREALATYGAEATRLRAAAAALIGRRS